MAEESPRRKLDYCIFPGEELDGLAEEKGGRGALQIAIFRHLGCNELSLLQYKGPALQDGPQKRHRTLTPTCLAFGAGEGPSTHCSSWGMKELSTAYPLQIPSYKVQTSLIFYEEFGGEPYTQTIQVPREPKNPVIKEYTSNYRDLQYDVRNIPTLRGIWALLRKGSLV